MLSKTVAVFQVISCNRINSTGLNKNFFHILGLESGMGVKIPQPGYFDPHPVICFLKLNKYHYDIELLHSFMLSL